MGNWTVKIIDKGYSLFCDIYIYRKVLENKIEFVSSNNTIKISEDGEVQEPTLRLDREQLTAFATALNQLGICVLGCYRYANPQKEFSEGKLAEATEKHLQDIKLRSWMFPDNTG